MFDDLHDPDPPRPGIDTLAAVSERARKLRRRRSALVGGAALVAVVALVAGVAAFVGDDDERLVGVPMDSAVPTSATVPTTEAVTIPSTTPAASAPAPSTAPTDPSTTTTTTLPAAPIEHLAIGDSVMLTAGPALRELGIVVDAVETRQMVDVVPVVEALSDQELLGDAVVVHLGTNGSFSQQTLDALMASLTDVPNVVVLTVRAERSWTEPNNAMIRALDGRPNVVVIDWEALGDACVGDCFASDGIHLRPDGQRYYAQLIGDVLGVTAPRPAAERPLVAVNGDGDAVYLPVGATEPVLLHDGTDPDDPPPVEGETVQVDGVAVLPDESAAFVGICCEPVAGSLLRTVPPAVATYDSFVSYGTSPTLDPSGTRIAAVSYFTIVVLDADGAMVASSDEMDAASTPIEVAWIDDATLVVLSVGPDGYRLHRFRVDGERLVEERQAVIAELDGDVAPRLAGVDDSVFVLGIEPDALVAFDRSTLERREGSLGLPGPALTAWFDGEQLVWVGTDRVLHVGDTVVPGEYVWARR